MWIHPDYKASYLVPEIDRKLFKRATDIVVVAKSCEANICKIFPEYADKVRTIENINSVAFIKKRAAEDTPPIKKAAVNFCTVARCDMDVKGLDRILTALQKLSESGCSDFLWHYIGDGRDYQQLQAKIDELTKPAPEPKPENPGHECLNDCEIGKAAIGDNLRVH